jgi:hypothetical protein
MPIKPTEFLILKIWGKVIFCRGQGVLAKVFYFRKKLLADSFPNRRWLHRRYNAILKTLN